jgi:hypothetical protein
MNNVNIGNSITVTSSPSSRFLRKHTLKHVGPDQWEYVSSIGLVMLLTTEEAKAKYTQLLRHPGYVTSVSSPRPKQKKARINNK